LLCTLLAVGSGILFLCLFSEQDSETRAVVPECRARHFPFTGTEDNKLRLLSNPYL